MTPAPGDPLAARRPASGAAAALALALLASACGRAPEPRPGAASDSIAAAPAYEREYLFVGERGGEPLAVPFVFRAVVRGAEIHRTARAWLAHDTVWEPFLDEQWTTPRAAGVWRVLPVGELRVAVGGPAEVEALSYRSGERTLRLEPGTPLASWSAGREARFRPLAGRLVLAGEVVPGTVVETLRIRAARPARGPGAPRGRDLLVLSAGDTLRLLLSAAPDGQGGFAWSGTPGTERWWESATVRALDTIPLDSARRNVPRHWSYAVPAAGMRGELRALGSAPVIGAESGGRRAVEVRYTVEGWVEAEGRRSRVVGVVRHVRD